MDEICGRRYRNFRKTGSFFEGEEEKIMKKNPGKKFLTALMVVFLTAASMPPAYAASGLDRFSDAKSHWAAPALEKAVDEGVLNGSDGKLNPNGTLTGAEMAVILVRKSGAQQWSQPYPGTSASNWYYMPCAVAMYEGILPQDGSLALKAPVTRSQVFLSFVRAYGYETGNADTEILSDYPDGALLSGEEALAAAELVKRGVISGDTKGMLNPQDNITRAEFVTMLYRAQEPAKNGFYISVSASDVPAGGSLKAEVSFQNAGMPKTCEAQWYLDGEAVKGYYAASKVIAQDTTSSFSHRLTFSRYMALSHRIGFGLVYTDAQTGRQVKLYAEKTVNVNNYSASHYDDLETTALEREALATVSSRYRGNYTSSYNIDYSPEIKQAFVHAKGYSSRTGYLVWVNLATQKVNVFGGSKGNWDLMRTFRCATGAPSTPTPVGVTYVTYKQSAWVTSSYTCRPIVRFYPGTGYAFHSRLYYPNSSRVKDASMGFPVSQGCVRMEDIGIYWLYNNIPVNTTVVIY